MTEITEAMVRRAQASIHRETGNALSLNAVRSVMAMHLALPGAAPEMEKRMAALEARLDAMERRPVFSYRPLSWGVQVGKPGAQKGKSALGWGVCS